MSDTSEQALVDELEAKQALHELNAAHARAADRLDRELMKSLWHPDATVDVGIFAGPASEYAELVTEPNEAMERSFHALSNEYYRILGDKAVGETYVIAVTTVVEGGEKIDRLVGGRYLDRYQRRNGEWKFSERVFVLDWNMNQPCTAVWDEGLFGQIKLRGARDGNDPIYNYWEKAL